MLLLMAIATLFSCKEKKCPCIETINLPEEKVCNVDNPLNDLEWLEKHINDIKKHGSNTRIYLVNYKDGYCIIQEFVAKCCEPFGDCSCDGTSHIFRNCDGYPLCYIEGMWGSTDILMLLSQNYYIGRCGGVDWEFELETMQLIYINHSFI